MKSLEGTSLLPSKSKIEEEEDDDACESAVVHIVSHRHGQWLVSRIVSSQRLFIHALGVQGSQFTTSNPVLDLFGFGIAKRLKLGN